MSAFPFFKNWQNITPDSIRFLYAEAEKSLLATVQTNATNRQAAYRILAILLPFIGLSFGYIITHPDWKFVAPASVSLAFEMIGAYLLIISLRSQPIMAVGMDPEDSIKEENIIEYDPDHLQLTSIMLQHCDSIQQKIDHNRKQNTYIARKVNQVIILAGCIGPLVFITFSLWVAYR